MPIELEPLAFVGTTDLCGLLRGQVVPVADLELLSGRGIYIDGDLLTRSPFASERLLGQDLVLLPDPGTKAMIPSAEGPDLTVLLGDLLEMDGAPWECCPRYFLRRGLAALHAEFGLSLSAAFQHEFVLTGTSGSTSLSAVRQLGSLGAELFASARECGAVPSSLSAGTETGRYGFATSPARGVAAADQAVIVRELIRAGAARRGWRASCTPLPSPGAAQVRTTITLRLTDEEGRPAGYDPATPDGLSAAAAQMLAGLLHHLPAVLALTAPASGLATPPGPAVRPVSINLASDEPPQLQAGLAFRAVDATASPYLALGALVWAGLDGLRTERPVFSPPSNERPSGSIDALEQSVDAAEWMGPLLRETYLRIRRREARALAGMDLAEICRRLTDAY